jgi:hypothetical protein
VISKEPAQHLALKLSSKTNKVNRGSMGTLRSVRQGGSQMNYEDTPPELLKEIKNVFKEECAKRGTPVNMEAVIDI